MIIYKKNFSFANFNFHILTNKPFYTSIRIFFNNLLRVELYNHPLSRNSHVVFFWAFCSYVYDFHQLLTFSFMRKLVIKTNQIESEMNWEK